MTRPWRLAQSTASSTLGLLPEPLIAMARSPGPAEVHQLLDENLVVAAIVADGENPAEVVGQAHHLEPPPRFVLEMLGPERAFAEVFAHVRGGRARAAVAEDEDERPLLPGVEHQIGPAMKLGKLDTVQFFTKPTNISGGVQCSTSIHESPTWPVCESNVGVILLARSTAEQHWHPRSNPTPSANVGEAHADSLPPSLTLRVSVEPDQLHQLRVA